MQSKYTFQTNRVIPHEVPDNEKTGRESPTVKGFIHFVHSKEMQPECSTPYPKAVLVHYLRLKEEGAK